MLDQLVHLLYFISSYSPSLLHQISAKKTHYLATLKLIPQWVSLFLLKSGLANLVSPVFRLSGTSATELVSTLTSNKDLHVIFSYLFYGEMKLSVSVEEVITDPVFYNVFLQVCRPRTPAS